MNNDTENPTAIQGKPFEGTLYVNSASTENLKLYGIATDNAAGVDSITVKVNNKIISSTETSYGTIKLIEGIVTNKDEDGAVTTVPADVKNTYLTWTENDIQKTEEISTEYKDVTEFTNTKIYWQLEIKPSVFSDLVDPQGDRPSVTYSYPKVSNSTIGGEVSIYGTATDTKGTNIGVDSVWVQIKSTEHKKDTSTTYANDLSYDRAEDKVTFTLTKDDFDYMAQNGYDVYKMSTYKEGVSTKWTKGTSSLGTGENASDYAALAKTSGAAWSLTINKNSEFDPPTGTGKNPIGIRVYARDGDGKFSLKAERFVSFDADGIKQVKIGDDILVDFTEEGEQIITVQSGWTNAVTIKNEYKEIEFKYPLPTRNCRNNCRR